MEAVAPVTLVYMLWKLWDRDRFDGLGYAWTTTSIGIATLFVMHYINRAVVSPLLCAPSMSPIHLIVVVMAGLFNFVNASCLAGWLAGYTLASSAFTNDIKGGLGGLILQSVGFLFFFGGLIGNMYSERCLFALRVQEVDRLEAKKRDKTTKNNKYHKVYVIPPAAGVFLSVLYPHYVFEWLEWLGFVLLGTAVFPSTQSVPESSHSSIALVPWLVPFAFLADKLCLPLPLPPLLFLVNAVANMLPHARWGRKWYVDRFGEAAVAGRGAVIPWCQWL